MDKTIEAHLLFGTYYKENKDKIIEFLIESFEKKKALENKGILEKKKVIKNTDEAIISAFQSRVRALEYSKERAKTQKIETSLNEENVTIYFNKINDALKQANIYTAKEPTNNPLIELLNNVLENKDDLTLFAEAMNLDIYSDLKLVAPKS